MDIHNPSLQNALTAILRRLILEVSMCNRACCEERNSDVRDSGFFVIISMPLNFLQHIDLTQSIFAVDHIQGSLLYFLVVSLDYLLADNNEDLIQHLGLSITVRLR